MYALVLLLQAPKQASGIKQVHDRAKKLHGENSDEYDADDVPHGRLTISRRQK
jgi:hypothetical protein